MVNFWPFCPALETRQALTVLRVLAPCYATTFDDVIFRVVCRDFISDCLWCQEANFLEKSGCAFRLVGATCHLYLCCMSFCIEKLLSALSSSHSSDYLCEAAWIFISSAVMKLKNYRVLNSGFCRLWPQCVTLCDIVIYMDWTDSTQQAETLSLVYSTGLPPIPTQCNSVS